MTYLICLVVFIALLVILLRYKPAGVGEQQIGGELGRAFLLIVLVLAFLTYSGIQAWHHFRWTP